MLKPFTASLYNIDGQKDDNGHWSEVPIFIKNVDCDVQPYSKELLIKSYGYDIECNKRFFCDYDENIGLNSIFKYKDKAGKIYIFQVQKIIDWDDLNLEIAALEVKDKWNLIQI